MDVELLFFVLMLFIIGILILVLLCIFCYFLFKYMDINRWEGLMFMFCRVIILLFINIDVFYNNYILF